jgi:hypothetical protein
LTNPPFQDSSHNEKKNTLWRKWINFADVLVEENGIFSLVIPSSWMGSPPVLKENFFDENQKTIKYNITHINRDECRRHFPNIGSTFSYFILENKRYDGSTSVVSNSINGETEVEGSVNLNEFIVDVFPRDLTKYGQSILKKTLSDENPKLDILNNTYNHSVHRTKWRKEPFEQYIYPIQNTPNKLYWYNYPHPHQGMIKLLIPTTTYFRTQLVTTNGVTQSFCYYLLKEGEEPDIVSNNINNKLFDYLNECFRYANWNSVSLLRKLPKIPLDRIMSDSDIYKFFKLNDQEINHINKLIKWR